MKKLSLIAVSLVWLTGNSFAQVNTEFRPASAQVPEQPAPGNPPVMGISQPPPLSSLNTPTPEIPQGFDPYVPSLGYQEARMWFTADYLLWWYRPQTAPTLAVRVPDGLAGAAAPATTIPLYPNDGEIDYGIASGIRLSAGGYFTDIFGVDASYFRLEQMSESGSFFSGSAGLPSIARPYFRAGAPTTTPIVLYSSLPGPGGYIGGTAIVSESELFGYDANLLVRGFALVADQTDYQIGYRYFSLEESIVIADTSIFPGGARLDVRDSYRVRNQFYGGQLGARARFFGNYGLGFDVGAKLALGTVAQRAELIGFNTVTTPAGAVSSLPGGLYVQPTNAGTHERNQFAAMGELNLNLTYQLTEYLVVSAGYSLIYLTNAARPGQLIDPTINDARVPYIAGAPANTTNAPLFRWQDQAFWTQGFNVGFSIFY